MKTLLSFIMLSTILTTTHAQQLFEAVRANDSTYVQHYIDIGGDVNATDEKGYSLLILAAYNESEAVARLLISSGCAINMADKSGNTALMGASFKGYKNIVTLLLENGADVNQRNGNGASAIFFAALFGRFETVKILKVHKANLKLTDATGKTPSDYSKAQENTEMTKLLND